MAFDVYQHVTDKIVAAIDQALSWEKPWSNAFGAGGDLARPLNAITKRPYRGINVPLLWAAYAPTPYWATYKAWQEAGAQVRKGEKGSTIIVWKQWTPKDGAGATADGEEPRARMMARAYSVFHAGQVDNWEAAPSAPAPLQPCFEPVAAVDAFVANTGAVVKHGGGRAFYIPSADYIQMPERGHFTGSTTSTAQETYYSTLCHELTHWTGDKNRCNRDFSGRFGDKAYAFEELIAELGAAFLSADLMLRNAPRADHAAYIKTWLSVLKNDKRAIFTAASKAEQACTYLAQLQQPAAIAA
jgi:antirestriction protein ArdC